MSDKFAVLRKSVDSDWTAVAVWDTWHEADRDCEERRKEEQNQSAYIWQRYSEPKCPCQGCDSGWAQYPGRKSCRDDCSELAEYEQAMIVWGQVEEYDPDKVTATEGGDPDGRT